MKKYLLLVIALSVGVGVQAADVMQFATVLSKPVGSFVELETTSCAYPDVKGQGTEYSEQVVVNFGYPGGSGGNINLQGGPVQIDSLLLEDDTVTKASGVWMLAADTTDPNNKGLLLYPNAQLEVGRIFINTLLLDQNSTHTLNIDNGGTLTIMWPTLTVKNLTVTSELGTNSFKVSNTNSGPGSASFKTINQTQKETAKEVTPSAGYQYLAY